MQYTTDLSLNEWIFGRKIRLGQIFMVSGGVFGQRSFDMSNIRRWRSNERKQAWWIAWWAGDCLAAEKTNGKKRSSKGSYTNYRFVGSSTIVWTCQALVCGLLKDSRTFSTVWFPRKFPNYFPILCLLFSLSLSLFFIYIRRISQRSFSWKTTVQETIIERIIVERRIRSMEGIVKY